jgi:hypothetical protein
VAANVTDTLSSYERYKDNLKVYTAKHTIVARKINNVSNLRLVVVIASAGGAILFYRAGLPAITGVVLSTGIVVFALLARWHSRLFTLKTRFASFAAVNTRGINRHENRWGTFKEAGSEFRNNSHSFSSDLDIFGEYSLFQYCCTARTCFGKRHLADLLRRDADSGETIRSRQEAIKELSPLADWRQGLEVEGFSLPAGVRPDGLLTWAEKKNGAYIDCGMTRQIMLWLPLVMVAAGLAGYIAGYSILFALPFAGLQLLMSVVSFNANGKRLNVFDKYTRHFAIYGNMLEHIGKREFTAPLLRQVQKSVSMKNREGAPAALRRLSRILSSSEVRLSPLPWFLANTLMLWDIRCVIRLEKWKERYCGDIRGWLEAIGAFEALSSLALFHYDHPEWSFPTFDATELRIEAEAVAHPLLPRNQRISNTVALGPPGGSVMIITGSNMSGKSTLLRTVGVNLVLAYAGAPVCAERLICTRMQLFTSMRTGDDLLSHTSTFYAELLRVKKIVDAIGKEEPMLYLLDELFRGTNSADRHDGAVALLNELSQSHTLGMISTHDLELCTLEEEKEYFRNAHFEEQYAEGKITFDYKLREGPSTTRNALYLMKMVGITGLEEKVETAS